MAQQVPGAIVAGVVRTVIVLVVVTVVGMTPVGCGMVLVHLTGHHVPTEARREDGDEKNRQHHPRDRATKLRHASILPDRQAR